MYCEYDKVSGNVYGGIAMLNRRCKCSHCAKRQGRIFGIILISVGTGLFLAYIIPYYLLITMLGLVLVCLGVSCLIKK